MIKCGFGALLHVGRKKTVLKTLIAQKVITFFNSTLIFLNSGKKVWKVCKKLNVYKK